MRNAAGSFAGSKGPNQLGLKDPIDELSTSFSRCCNNHIKLCQQIKRFILINPFIFTQRTSNENKAIKRSDKDSWVTQTQMTQLAPFSLSISSTSHYHIKLCEQIKGNILNNLSTFTQRESNERKAIKRERNEKELGPFDPTAKPLGRYDPNGQLSHARSR